MARWQGQLIKIDDYRWKIPENYKTGMRVPGLIYASKEMLESIVRNKPRTSRQCCLSPRYSRLLLCYAGYPLGLWLPYRRSGGNGY